MAKFTSRQDKTTTVAVHDETDALLFTVKAVEMSDQLFVGTPRGNNFTLPLNNIILLRDALDRLARLLSNP